MGLSPSLHLEIFFFFPQLFFASVISSVPHIPFFVRHSGYIYTWCDTSVMPCSLIFFRFFSFCVSFWTTYIVFKTTNLYFYAVYSDINFIQHIFLIVYLCCTKYQNIILFSISTENHVGILIGISLKLDCIK